MSDPAVIEQYSLRASFISNRLLDLGYIGLVKRAKKIISSMDKNLDLGGEFSPPNPDVMEIMRSTQIPVSLVFAHPALLLASPIMLQYYRCIAAFPIKGLQRVSGVSGISDKETGLSSLSDIQALKVASAINSHANLLFLSQNDFSAERINALLYASAGITLDGSWRNQIGAEGERATKKAILERLIRLDEIGSFITKDGNAISDKKKIKETLDEAIDQIQSVQCINGGQIVFASEPDLRFVNTKGKTTAGIEVKAGLDPAGALERLGAMLKSFEELKLTSPDADTILLASCITDEVQSRLNASKSVDIVMTLADILTNEKSMADKLVTRVRKYTGLIT